MSKKPLITLAPLEGATQYAPLVGLGFACREQDIFSPIFSRLKFPKGLHTEHPENALMSLFVSMLAGCRSISQINTKIRPDLALANAWGMSRFVEQSTVARVLEQTKQEQREQLRSGIEAIYHWIGQAPRHNWEASLLIDIDLTGLPCSAKSEGGSKGYFSEKKAAMDGNYVGLAQPSMMRALAPCFTQAIRSASTLCKQQFGNKSRFCGFMLNNENRLSSVWMVDLAQTRIWDGYFGKAIKYAPKVFQGCGPVLSASRLQIGSN